MQLSLIQLMVQAKVGSLRQCRQCRQCRRLPTLFWTISSYKDSCTIACFNSQSWHTLLTGMQMSETQKLAVRRFLTNTMIVLVQR